MKPRARDGQHARARWHGPRQHDAGTDWTQPVRAAPTDSSPSSFRWRRRDTVRAYLAEAEPIKDSTDTAVKGEEGMPDEYDGEELEDVEFQETDLAAF